MRPIRTVIGHLSLVIGELGEIGRRLKRRLKASKPGLKATFDVFHNTHYFVSHSNVSVQVKKPSGGPKGLIGPPCHGAPWPPEVRMIFYFHGFASSERSWKIDLLKKQLTTGTIIAPTLPIDPAGVVKLFEQVVTENGKPGLVIGSSLGGFYAYYAATRFDIPAVLINPSITPWVTLKDHIGIHKRYYTGEPFEWKAQYLDALKRINDEIKDYDSKHHRLHFFLSADDEVLDLSVIPTKFTAAGSIRFYDNCGHSFNRFAEIIPEIEKLLGGK